MYIYITKRHFIMVFATTTTTTTTTPAHHFESGEGPRNVMLYD